jgi:hypothetical protein
LANACSSRFHRRTPGAVAAAAVGGDQQTTGLRMAGATHAVPPTADRVDCEAGGIVVDADTHPSRVAGDVIDPIRHGATKLRDQKIVHPHRLGLSLRTQLAAAILAACPRA